MEIIKFVGIGIVGAVLAITVKKASPALALQVSIAAGILIFLMSLEYLTQAIGFLRELSDKYPKGTRAFTLVLKVIGIAYLAEFAVQVIKDAGETAIAGKVELAGKLLILVLTMPMLGEFLNTVLGLLI